jgi:ABC-type multidrug transport system fused ATPase/permease subunit
MIELDHSDIDNNQNIRHTQNLIFERTHLLFSGECTAKSALLLARVNTLSGGFIILFFASFFMLLLMLFLSLTKVLMLTLIPYNESHSKKEAKNGMLQKRTQENYSEITRIFCIFVHNCTVFSPYLAPRNKNINQNHIDFLRYS